MALFSFILNVSQFPQATQFGADNYDHSYYGRAMIVNLVLNCGAAICLLYSGTLTIQKKKWDSSYVLGLAGVAMLSCANLPTTYNLLVNIDEIFWSTLFINLPGLIIAVIGCVVLASCRRDICGDKNYSGMMLGYQQALSPEIPPGDQQAKRNLDTESGREAAGTLMMIVAIFAFSYIFGSIYNYNEKPNENPPFVGLDILALYLLPLIVLTVAAGASGFLSTARKRWGLSFPLALLSMGVAIGYFVMVFHAAMYVFEGRPYFINGFIFIQSMISMIFAIIAGITIGWMRKDDAAVRINHGRQPTL